MSPLPPFARFGAPFAMTKICSSQAIKVFALLIMIVVCGYCLFMICAIILMRKRGFAFQMRCLIK